MSAFFTKLFKSNSSRPSKNQGFRPSFDHLEDRQLLTAAAIFHPVPGINALRITGTESGETIMVRQMNNQITVSGVTGSFSVAGLSYIDVRGLGGNDMILLNSEQLGGQQLSVGCIVDGGAGNDLIMGSARNDVIFGGAGNDTIHGLGGNDTIDGGMGADQLFGDFGDDLIRADLTDTSKGGIGMDRIILPGLDPSQLPLPPAASAAGYDMASALKTVLNSAPELQNFSFSYDKDGDHVKVNNLHVSDVTIANGQTRITFTADYSYRKTRGLVQGGVSGSIKFSFQPVLGITVGDSSGVSRIDDATLTMTNTNVIKITLNHPSWLPVPSWVTNSPAVINFMNGQLSNQPPIHVPGVIQAYLNAGGSIGDQQA